MNKKSLKGKIDLIYREYHSPEYLSIDPLVCVRQYGESQHVEIVGFVAACLSYGKVENIIASINTLLDAMGSSVTDFVFSTSYKKKKECLKNFYYRFNNGDDIALLFQTIHYIYQKFGSLENLFIHCFEKSNFEFKDALHSFVQTFLEYGHGITKKELPRSFKFLLPTPLCGSACKRLNMYLRWMIRENDGIDMGVWKSISPQFLVIPVDTHIARVARYFGLTRRNSADWKTAEEITAHLRAISPDDPVKYDFSLCRFGMKLFNGKKSVTRDI